jgi:hypothetical protein
MKLTIPGATPEPVAHIVLKQDSDGWVYVCVNDEAVLYFDGETVELLYIDPDVKTPRPFKTSLDHYMECNK